MFGAQQVIEIPAGWRNDCRGAQRALALFSAACSDGASWSQREALLERLTCEVISRVHVPGSLPLSAWYGELFDAALLVMQQYVEIHLVGGEPQKPDEKASMIVLDAWQRQRDSWSF
jgi:hypothetical protein